MILALLPILIFSQGENDNWYFGKKAAVNFSSSTTTTVFNNSQMDAFEACGTASDANGKLLFYTDGRTVWNRDHLTMLNGTGLAGLDSSQQLAIVKHPGNSNLYYIFTTGVNVQGTAARIAYSVVDITQGNIGIDGLPLGKVVDGLKNINVVDAQGNQLRTEAITIVPTKSGTFWVLIPNGNRLYSYLFSDVNGFNNGNPVVSNLNFPGSLSHVDGNHFAVKASPKLSSSYYNYSHYLSISSWTNPDSVNVIYSFNNSTGQITQHYRLEIYTSNSYTTEFNKDGSVLFLGFETLYAINLQASSTSTPVYTPVHYFGGYNVGAMQRNKYNDIYFSIPYRNYLGKINNPDVYGSGISATENVVNLGSGPSGVNTTFYGLPQLIEPRVFETQPSRCLSNILLTNPEGNINYAHRATETIRAETDYSMNSSNGNISMKAGKSITLSPNTYIKSGSDYLAKIEPCVDVSRQQNNEIEQKPVFMKLYLDQKEIKNNELTVYPNPATDLLGIKSNIKVDQVTVYDISGKKINVSLFDNKVDVRNLPSGAYIISIETKEGKTTKKFIKK